MVLQGINTYMNDRSRLIQKDGAFRRCYILAPIINININGIFVKIMFQAQNVHSINYGDNVSKVATHFK